MHLIHAHSCSEKSIFLLSSLRQRTLPQCRQMNLFSSEQWTVGMERDAPTIHHILILIRKHNMFWHCVIIIMQLIVWGRKQKFCFGAESVSGVRVSVWMCVYPVLIDECILRQEQSTSFNKTSRMNLNTLSISRIRHTDYFAWKMPLMRFHYLLLSLVRTQMNLATPISPNTPASFCVMCATIRTEHRRPEWNNEFKGELREMWCAVCTVHIRLRIFACM